jgi:serine/threonine-protein kinase
MPVRPGSRLGGFEVIALIGAGAIGEVYRARDVELGRNVALKILSDPSACPPDRIARFEREARVLASLNHPNIATIHRIEQAGGVRAIVMELVDGPALADLVASGPVDVATTVTIALQLADALEVAHERGIIHRDLKPANVKVTPAGRVKLLDFGLAKIVTDQLTLDAMVGRTQGASATQEGLIVGTPAYMSPEQLRGDASDKRTDIWAFGCVLFELLSGRRAFGAETFADTVAAILERDRTGAIYPRRRRQASGACWNTVSRRIRGDACGISGTRGST